MNAWQARDIRVSMETGGVWMRSKAVPGWAFRLARDCPWNAAFHTAMFQLGAEPHIAAYLDRARQPGYIRTPEDAGTDAELVLRAFIRGHLGDWAGVYGPDGANLSFSEDNARKLFAHFPDVFAECAEFARNGANYSPRTQADLEAIALGN